TLLIISLTRPPTSPLFPYTTLFRSRRLATCFEAATPDHLDLGHDPQRPQQLIDVSVEFRCFWPGWLLQHGQRSSLQRAYGRVGRSEEHTSELQSRENLVCRLLLEKK